MAVSDHQAGQPEVSLTDLLMVMSIMVTRMMMVMLMAKMMMIIIISLTYPLAYPDGEDDDDHNMSSTYPLANIIRKRSQRTKAMDTWSWLDQDEDEDDR